MGLGSRARRDEGRLAAAAGAEHPDGAVDDRLEVVALDVERRAVLDAEEAPARAGAADAAGGWGELMGKPSGRRRRGRGRSGVLTP